MNDMVNDVFGTREDTSGNDVLATALRTKLRNLGVTNKEVLANTPQRWIKFLEEYSTSLSKDYNDFKVFETTNDQMVIVETSFYSLCEHHLLPYYGKAFVAYIPSSKVVGVSKIVKLVGHMFRKPSIQEGVTKQIADAMKKNLETSGVAVTVRGFHLCVGMRYNEGWMTTSEMQGVFQHNPYAKQEYMTYIQQRLGEMR